MATRLRSRVTCDAPGPAGAVVTFSWSPAARPGREQRVVLSYLPGGLDSGAFLQSPPLRPDQAELSWPDLIVGTGPLHWRVLTRHGGAWAASPTATLSGDECA